MKQKELESLKLNMEDLFLLNKSQMTALPKFKKIKAQLSGRHATYQRGRGEDFESSRIYTMGDDIRNIDWKVSARVGKVYTKVFTQEKELPCYIICDLSQTMLFGTQKSLKAELALKLSVLLGFKILSEGDRVGGFILSNKSVEYFSPKRDKQSFFVYQQRLLDTYNSLLETKQELDTKESLSETITHINQVAPKNSLIIVISDFSRSSDKVIDTFIDLKKHNDIIAIKVVDPFEQNLTKFTLPMKAGGHKFLFKGASYTPKEIQKIGVQEDYMKMKKKLSLHNIPLIKFTTDKDINSQIVNIGAV